MSQIIESDATMKVIQGDSFYFPFYDIPHDKDYLLSVGIFDSNRNFMFELSARTEHKRTLRIEVEKTLSDLLTVFKSYKFQTYYYGAKLSDTETGQEDTCTVNNKDYGSLNRLIVYPKQSEGL